MAACGAVDRLFAASTTVRVAVTWGDAELAAFQSVVDGFRRQFPQYEVDVIPLGDDIAEALTSQVTGRPDVVLLPRPGLVTEHVGQLAPLPEDVWPGDALSPAWRGLVWHPGPAGRPVPYGLPFKVANQSALWYRGDVFDAHHLAPPRTWSEWLRLNDSLLRLGITPLALGAGDGWPLAAFFANVLRSAHPDTYDRLGTPDPPVDLWRDVPFRQALRLLGGMLSVDGVLTGGVDRALAQQFPDAMVEVFGYHRAAMVVSADFAEPTIAQFIRPPAVVRVVPFPVVDGVDAAHAGPDDADLLVGSGSFAGAAPVVVGADIAVLPAPAGDGATAFVRWLAQPASPLPWITTHGGFIAANLRTPRAAYTGSVRRLADQVAAHPFAFNLSDALGSLGGSGGLWQALEDFLRTVGDGRTYRITDAAATAAGAMHDIEAAHGR